MHSNASEAPAPSARPSTAPEDQLPAAAQDALKIVVVGGFGVGKTTMVGTVSEIRPLSTEEVMTEASVGVDDPSGVRSKTTTTAAFDFGRITITQDKILYLFGAPGQERFWFLWDQLFAGSLGAVVLVDSRRLEESWYAVDRLEAHGMPFVVAVNRFEPGPDLERLRDALSLAPNVPLVECDARSKDDCKAVLIALVRHLNNLYAPSPAREGTP